MKARGKREARRPWYVKQRTSQPYMGVIFRPFRPYAVLHLRNQGRCASRLPLAFIFRAFGAALSSERGGEFAREDEAQGAA
jgi:hypothetical protein